MRRDPIALDVAAGNTTRLTIVVPAFNEEAGIGQTLRQIAARAIESGLPFELIVVDDGSSDGTWRALELLCPEIPELCAVRFSRNFGKEAAIAAGIERAGGDATIIMDADLQHPPELIPEMVRLWRTEAWDVVEAVKLHRGREQWIHKALARFFYESARLLTGHNLRDASDYKLLDRRVVEAWRRFGERATFFRGLVSWLGFRRAQIYFEVPERIEGGSRWSFGTLTGLAIHAVTSFSAVPLQIVTALGLVTLLIAVGVGIQALRLWYEDLALPGFTTVVLLQLTTSGFLMLSLGIIGTYIARIYDEVKARPRYIIRDIAGND